MIQFSCPTCKGDLVGSSDNYHCLNCNRRFPIINGIPVFTIEDCTPKVDKMFYEEWYIKLPQPRRWSRYYLAVKDVFLKNKIIRRILFCFLFFYLRRDEFFRRILEKKYHPSQLNKPLILDLACGQGMPFLKQYGDVVGCDLSYHPLIKAGNSYDQVIQASVLALPFPDQTFDYIISSDLLGHIPKEQKDQMLREILRVLKSDGLTAHVAETDSTNVFFRWAKNFPELFHKYFIEAAGGHFGLELPSITIDRFRKNGFTIISAEKIWGPIWKCEDYLRQFDNEYKKKSFILSGWVGVCRLLAWLLPIKILVNFFFGMLCTIQMKFSPLNNGQGLLVVMKKNEKNI